MLSPSIDAGLLRPSQPRPVAVPRGRNSAELHWFDEVAAAHLPALRARAAQLCRGHGDADDIVQDALMRAFVARGQMKHPERARGWLLTIVTHTFLDSLRRRRARPGEVALEIEPPAPALDDDAAEIWADLSLDDIRAAVSRLPDDVRETYQKFALDGCDYTQIAAELGVPKATVGTRILRARKRLRELLLTQLGGAHVPA
jgi:RNA polymerase sigma-70 factor, ECF subfamily